MDALTYFTQETDARRNPDPGDMVVSRSERRLVIRVLESYGVQTIYYYAGWSWSGIVLEQEHCSIEQWRSWAQGGRIETD